MLMPSMFTRDLTRYWIYQKTFEAVTFLFAFISTNAFLDQKSILDPYGLKVALGAIVSYGVISLYWPGSWILTYFGRNGFKAYQVSETMFYILHSFIFLSLFYGGIFGLSENIKYTSPLVLGWISVIIVHVGFIIFGEAVFNIGQNGQKKPNWRAR